MPRGTHGSITATKLKAAWKARAYYRGHDGVRAEVCRYGDTKRDAVQRLEDALSEILAVGRGGAVRNDDTLAKVAKLWQAGLEGGSHSKGTVRAYKSIVKCHITSDDGQLGSTEIRHITPAMVMGHLAEVRKSSGPGAEKSLRTVYRLIFDLAIQNDALDANPARGFKQAGTTASQTKKVVRAFTRKERDDILAKVAKDERAIAFDLPILMQMLAGTGARITEVICVNWSDIFWKENRIHIPGTKTASSDRIISAPEWLMGALRLRSESLASDLDSPVCPSPLGKRRDSSNSIRSVSRWLDGNGYPWATSHTFRKTVATLLDEQGFTPRQIADHLGHAQPSLTMDVYMDRTQVVDRVGKSL